MSKSFNKIAKLEIERGTGARGLKSILEETLVDAMYELPGKKILSNSSTKFLSHREEATKLRK